MNILLGKNLPSLFWRSEVEDLVLFSPISFAM